MAIFLDRSETTIKKLIPQAGIVPDLEEQTGADLLISAMGLPATTPELLKCHMSNGALLVQGKWSSHDLMASIMDDRLIHSLERMRRWGSSIQCILLVVMDPVPDDGILTQRIYPAFSKFQDRGGRVEYPLATLHNVVEWCIMKEKHLEEYAKHPIKWTLDNRPSLGRSIEEDPLQLLAPVPKDDPRRALIQCPGIGIELATRIWEALNVSAPDSSLWRALAWMTVVRHDDWGLPGIEGFGAGKRKVARAWLGLEDGMELGIQGMSLEQIYKHRS